LSTFGGQEKGDRLSAVACIAGGELPAA